MKKSCLPKIALTLVVLGCCFIVLIYKMIGDPVSRVVTGSYDLQFECSNFAGLSEIVFYRER